jgi:hypothetical protein
MIKKLAIRSVTPLSWRHSPARLGSSLHRFSQVEADSAWQMLQALEASDDPSFQVKLFNNALEEVHHAALFAGLARDFSSSPLPLSAAHRKALYSRERGLTEFEAHHFVGEADVYRQFLSYAHAAQPERVREMFLQIRGDEDEHQKLAYAELVRLTGSKWKTRQLILQVRLKRVYEAWLRMGRAMGDVVSSALLTTIYFAAAPIFFRICQKRLEDARWQQPALSDSGPVAGLGQTADRARL